MRLPCDLAIKRFLQQEKSGEPKAGKTQGANAQHCGTVTFG